MREVQTADTSELFCRIVPNCFSAPGTSIIRQLPEAASLIRLICTDARNSGSCSQTGSERFFHFPARFDCDKRIIDADVSPAYDLADGYRISQRHLMRQTER